MIGTNLKHQTEAEGRVLRILKKTIVKDDGRNLIYYHFPDTGTVNQKQAFDDVPVEPTETVVPEKIGNASTANGTDGAIV